MSEDKFANLDSALQVLGGGSSQVRLEPGCRKADPLAIECYAAVPSFADPRALLPLNATAPAWRAVLGQHTAGAANPMARAAARLLRLASPIGVRSLLLRDRLSVVADCDDRVETPLHQFLGEVLGRKDFVTSFRLAPFRPNGKPVVQAVARNGTVLAYAKFGWEGLTRQLIRHEATVLGELAPLTRGMPLKVPAVLYSGEWHGLEALVLSSLSCMRRTPRSSADVPIAASVALAGLSARVVQQIGASAFWRRTASQMAQVAPLLSDRARQITLEACAAVEDHWGDFDLPTGHSHGDWIPPNMSIRTDGAFNVWDWEHGGRDVPLGIDAMQFILFVELRRRAPDRTLAGRLQAYGEAALSRHGLDPRTSVLLMVLSLLGSILWFGQARAVGRQEKEDDRFTRALEVIVDPCRGLNALKWRPQRRSQGFRLRTTSTLASCSVQPSFRGTSDA